ncbi:hypothetical protein NDA16_005169 [Ustilago loliicola]|nr:hypothetical protein NDA16_005169 [Ustilago loliicola]
MPSSPNKKPLPTPKPVDLAALDASIQAIPLGDDIFVFDPWAVDTSTWPTIVSKDGDLTPTTPYALLAHAFVTISATRSRLAITTLLTNLLRTVRAHDPDSLLPTVYLVSNHIAPPYDGVELGLGGSIINKAIKSVTGKSARFMKQVWDKTGDPGDVAYEAKKDVKALYGLAGLSEHVPLRIGTPISPMLGSITRSLGAMHEKLGSRAFVSEFKYDGQRCQIHAIYVPRSAGPEARRSVKEETSANNGGAKCGKWVGKKGEVYVRLFSRHLEEMSEKYPDITDMAPILMGQEREADANIGASAFVDGSTSSMKPQPDNPVESSDATNPEDPETLATDGKREPITSFIMDAEVVAMDLDGRLLPFQTLANRSRKDVNLHDIKVKVGVFAFDLMYLDGESLLKSSFRTRRNLLHSRFLPLSPQSPLIARFAHVRSCESTDPDDVARFFSQAQEYKCEGIMVKSLDHHWEAPPDSKDGGEDDAHAGQPQDGTDIDEDGAAPNRLHKLADVVDDDLAMDNEDEAVKTLDDGGSKGSKRNGNNADNSTLIPAEVGKGVNGRGKALLSTYEPDKRCESWLKVKKDYVDGLGDSLDLVPIGAWHGMGRKATWWSPILLALYDPETGVLQAVCKCISGFTDAFYKDLNVRYAEGSDTCVRSRWGEPSPFGIELETGNLWPDVWWKPSEVWELRGADVTISPNYTAAIGLVSEERGLSIRFPRFMRRREEKTIEQAMTPAMLAKMYFEQQKAAPAPGEGEGEGVGPDEEGDSEEEPAGDKLTSTKAAVDDDFEF